MGMNDIEDAAYLLHFIDHSRHNIHIDSTHFIMLMSVDILRLTPLAQIRRG